MTRIVFAVSTALVGFVVISWILGFNPFSMIGNLFSGSGSFWFLVIFGGANLLGALAYGQYDVIQNGSGLGPKVVYRTTIAAALLLLIGLVIFNVDGLKGLLILADYHKQPYVTPFQQVGNGSVQPQNFSWPTGSGKLTDWLKVEYLIPIPFILILAGVLWPKGNGK